MLSLGKLEKLLYSKNFTVLSYFSLDKLCVYMEIVSMITGDVLFLYIPSKYSFPMEGQKPCYEVEYLDIDNDVEKIAHSFATQPDSLELSSSYRSVSVNDTSANSTGLTKELENDYRHNITITDRNNKEKKNVNDIIRQIRRLKLCVESTRYKICIIYKDCMCSIRRDDELELIRIKNYPVTDQLRLCVRTDLEFVYTKLEFLQDNIHTIKNNLFSVLINNQQKNSANLRKLLQEKERVHNYIATSISSYQISDNRLKSLIEMLQVIVRKEKSLVNEINTFGNQPIGTSNYDTIGHQRELIRIRQLKSEIVTTILHVNKSKEHSVLSIDNVLFDNQIMLKQVLENFSNLSNI